MELHPTEAKRLVAIERELGLLAVSPAEAAVIHRVIAATGDFELGQLLRFSSDGLKSGAAALASRSALIVDIPAIQIAIQPQLQESFANRVCRLLPPGQAWMGREGMASFDALSQRYPNAIYVVGQTESAIAPLEEKILGKAIYPALVVATFPHFEKEVSLLSTLQKTGVPYVVLAGRRGNAMAAIAILEMLIEMTWQIYRHESRRQHSANFKEIVK